MQLDPPVSSADHARGPADAPVTLVEFGDYECPYCKQASSILDGLATQFGSTLRIVFRNFPLSEIHRDALNAALVAESADMAQFWKLHDIMYVNQRRLDAESLVGYAVQAGVQSQVARAALEGSTLQRVRGDVTSGNQSGVNGTPTFFINGNRHVGDWSQQSLAHAIQKIAGKS